MELLQVWNIFCLCALKVVLGDPNSTHYNNSHAPSYLLVAPSTVRPGVPTSVSVTVLGSSSLHVSANISNGGNVLSSGVVIVEGGFTKMLTLPPFDFSHQWGMELEVKGHSDSGLVFHNRTELNVDLKGVSTFIQTDKANYRPGQKVKFRVVSIHPDGKPAIGPVHITVRDPKENLLRQWESEDGELGVVSLDFQLSEIPPLGNWTIHATVDGVKSKQHFHVDNYVLPKFKVWIDVPDAIYHEDALWGSVTAKHSYGIAVEGEMFLTFVHHFHGMVETYTEHREINGMTDFSFLIPENYPMRKRAVDFLNKEYISVFVNVTEHLTGVTYNDSATVCLEKHRYKLSFYDYPKILRPLLYFVGRLKITTFDGKPLPPTAVGSMVTVSVMQGTDSPWGWPKDTVGDIKPWDNLGPRNMPPPTMGSPEVMEIALPSTGIVNLHILVKNDTQTLTIDASFGDSHRTLQLYRSYTSASNSYLQIHQAELSPQVGSPFRLQVSKTFPEDNCHFVVRSRGQVVSAGTSSSVLDLLPEHSWAPEACVIVFCVLPSGEIVTDKITLELRQLLKNQVSLSFSTNTTSPGEPVTLTVKVMEPGSLVGLLVVDQSSAWMGSNNDITKEKVMEELESYDAPEDYSENYMLTRGDPYSVFTSCELEVLTDASFHGQDFRHRIEFEHQNMDLLTSTPPELEPRVRRNFPETWIWMDLHLGDSDTRQIPVEAPDTITTWVATAFVMSQSLGLGIIREPVELTVFQDFFLSLNLPAYLIRGEEVVLEVVLYNYLPQDLQVKVIVAANHAFHFVLHNDDALPSHSVHLVSVGGQDGALVLVPIKPVVLGEVVISVSARSTVAADAVTRKVLVKPEGLEQSFSTSMLFEVFPYQPTVSKNVQFIFPPDVVEGSQRVTVTAVGDILGPSINGLESLIKLPYGCGEQNMINFAPNIYVLQYLEVTGQTTTDIRRRAIQSMEKGYMQELSYQRRDGSFSAFGDSDPSGSTWLTAFVIRCFMQAKLFIVIDQNVVRVSGNWLSFQQAADGSFLEPGRVIHTELQGGLGGSTALTAYVLIALLEVNETSNTYHTQASAALMFLEERLSESSISSTYVLSLVAYALSLAQSPNAHMAVNELIGRASITDGVPLWSPLSPREPRSADIEMVSYLLLSLYRLERISEGVAIMKWLSQQRNSFGGYGSTQDTVVALQALSTFASHGGAITNNLNLEVLREDGERVAVFFIHQDNYLLLQSDQLDPEPPQQYTVTASGQGLAVFQLNVFYNIKSEELMRRKREAQDDEAFNLHVELHDLEKEDSPQLFICTSLSESSGLNSTGMAILDIGLLSGLSLAQDGIQTNEVVKKVETEPGKVIVYLDYVTTADLCLTVPLVPDHRVAKVQGAVVSVYDYYEPARRTVRVYTSEWRTSSSVCSFCGEDCQQCSTEYDDDDDHYDFPSSRGSRKSAKSGRGVRERDYCEPGRVREDQDQNRTLQPPVSPVGPGSYPRIPVRCKEFPRTERSHSIQEVLEDHGYRHTLNVQEDPEIQQSPEALEVRFCFLLGDLKAPQRAVLGTEPGSNAGS